MWDKDIASSNDCIAERTFDCGIFFRRAYKKGVTVEAFPTPKGTSRAGRSLKKKSEKRKKKQHGEAASICTQAAKGDHPWKFQDGKWSHPRNDGRERRYLAEGASSMDGNETEGVEMVPHGEASPGVDLEAGGAVAARHNVFAEANEEKKAAKEKAAKEADEFEFIRDIKEMSGLWPSIDPKNSTWLELSRKDWDNGGTEKKMGEVRTCSALLTFSLV